MSVNYSPDPSDVLDDADELRSKGNYEEALQKYIWYHEHAIQCDPSHSAVRLGSALGDWVRLGEVYPPAREALIAVRDRKSFLIRSDARTYELFEDVAAINCYLNQPSETVDLFLLLHHSDRNLARECYRKAEESLAATGEYVICSYYTPDPRTRLAAISEARRNMLAICEPVPDAKQRAGMGRAVERLIEAEVVRLIHILRGADRSEEADEVRDLAAAELGREFDCSQPFDRSVGCTCGRRSSVSSPGRDG